MEKKQLGRPYKVNLTFYENNQLMKGKYKIYTGSTLDDIMEQARIYAFNHKYGHYDYEIDIRANYANWYIPLQKLIEEKVAKTKGLSVLDVGANCGKELVDIFDPEQNNLMVLDISDEAVKLGQDLYQNVKFFNGNMEKEYPFQDEFDVILCLRSIQSTGVSRQDTIIQMVKRLKKGGLIVVSIPNGYFDNKVGKIARGLYDYRAECINPKRPLDLALKVSNKFSDYGLTENGVNTYNTEIVVWGMKN